MSTSLNRVKEVVDKVRHIQEEAEQKAEGAAKYITDRCNTIAKDEHGRLNVIVDNKTGELISQPVCSYRYYSKLMEDYRNGVKALGFKHHAIERHVSAFIKKYSSKYPDLEKQLNPSLPIETLRENLILLRSSSITGSDFRKDLLKLKIEHHAFYMFEPKGAIKDWISDDSKKQLEKKLHSQILVNPDWIKKLSRDLLTKIDPSVSDLCIGIAIATGRRLTEIMKTASFKAVAESTILFSGQLKTKNRHLFEEVKPYKIPSMIEADIVVKALSLLRKATGKDQLRYKNVLGETVESTVDAGDIKDYYHNRAVHKKYESTMNRAVRSLLNNGHFKLKDCRALYTEVTKEEHAKSGEAPSAYRHRVLGHSLMETQMHYEAFQLDRTIASIKLCEIDDDGEPMTDQQKALADYLGKADADVKGYVRAPKIAIMHEWLKNEVANGLKLEQITPSYIRRYCLFDGKQLNLNTIKTYVNEFIQLDKFELPKAKPKKPDNKKAREIFELEERIEEINTRTVEINDECNDLEEERDEIELRLSAIDDEEEQLNAELDVIKEELEELEDQLEVLQAELEAEDNQDADEESDLAWPDANDIDVTAVKVGKQWHLTANVNGKEFEMYTGGRKDSAIKELRNYYKKSIMAEDI
ncbi:protelomerase family protein [Shewanella baltica]|uniref:protelomerase family protein n=1 Tax=Shewanella baltica TaxID=62322 RepID=UPI00217D9309|nr:protelomerase family protein [Shewanella baltica]MCS6257439.1 hypothetical protein [Shewanella baltica]MCS6272595.1 hypothetical protein [Shewanella baltica]